MGADAPDVAVDRPGLQDLGEQEHDLDLRGGAVRAHELDAELRELTGLAAQRGLLPHDRGAVAKARGQFVLADAAGHEARDGEREVGAQDEQTVIGVEELERGVPEGAPALQRRAVLEQWRLHGQIAMGREARANGVRDALARERLFGKDVTKATGRLSTHVWSSPARGPSRPSSARCFITGARVKES